MHCHSTKSNIGLGKQMEQEAAIREHACCGACASNANEEKEMEKKYGHESGKCRHEEGNKCGKEMRHEGKKESEEMGACCK